MFEIENIPERNYSPKREIIRRIRVRPFLIRLIRRIFVAGPETFQRGGPTLITLFIPSSWPLPPSLANLPWVLSRRSKIKTVTGVTASQSQETRQFIRSNSEGRGGVSMFGQLSRNFESPASTQPSGRCLSHFASTNTGRAKPRNDRTGSPLDCIRWLDSSMTSDRTREIVVHSSLYAAVLWLVGLYCGAKVTGLVV